MSKNDYTISNYFWMCGNDHLSNRADKSAGLGMEVIYDCVECGEPCWNVMQCTRCKDWTENTSISNCDADHVGICCQCYDLLKEESMSDHIPDATKMVDVKPESDKNKYTMLPADPEGFIIFKPDFDIPCGEILAWVDDFSDNAQKILCELNQLQNRVAELESENKGLKEFIRACTKPKKAANEEA